MSYKFIVTGGCGFVGANLSKYLSDQGHQVIILDNLSRQGTERNKQWLSNCKHVQFVYCDLRQSQEVSETIKKYDADCVFHLAGQVAMTTSLADPVNDMLINVNGTVNILNALRLHKPTTALVYASTNKVYGGLDHLQLVEKQTRYSPIDGQQLDIDETTRIDFQTPYGCSKGSADQYVIDFHKNYGLNTAVFRHSTIYGGRQYANFDQGWIGWFCRQAIIAQRDKSHTFTVNGNGKQVRDLLYIDDAVSCYYQAFMSMDKCKGQAFNIGGGIHNSMSIVELLQYCSLKCGVDFNISYLPNRVSDQMYYVSCIQKAYQTFGWSPNIPLHEGIDRMLDWERESLA